MAERKEELLDNILENEKEWRRYMVKRLDKLDQDFNLFKIKTFGFVTVLTAAVNLFVELFRHK
jgi:hypothetical protein